MNGVRRGRTRLFALILAALGRRRRRRASCRSRSRRARVPRPGAAPAGAAHRDRGARAARSWTARAASSPSRSRRRRSTRFPTRCEKPRAAARGARAAARACRRRRSLEQLDGREGIRLAPPPGRPGGGRAGPRAEAARHPLRRGAQALLPEGPPRRRGPRLRRHGRHAAWRASSTSTTSTIRGKPGEIVALTDARRSRYGEAETASSRPAAGRRVARALARLGRPVRRRARARGGDGASTARSRAASSCSIPGTARSSRWRRAPDFDPNEFGALSRPSRGATARSPTPTSRARRSRS